MKNNGKYKIMANILSIAVELQVKRPVIFSYAYFWCPGACPQEIIKAACWRMEENLRKQVWFEHWYIQSLQSWTWKMWEFFFQFSFLFSFLSLLAHLLSICFSLYLFICPLSFYSICCLFLSLSLPVYLSAGFLLVQLIIDSGLSICLCFYLAFCLSIFKFSVHISVFLSIFCLQVCSSLSF